MHIFAAALAQRCERHHLLPYMLCYVMYVLCMRCLCVVQNAQTTLSLFSFIFWKQMLYHIILYVEYARMPCAYLSVYI